MADIHQITDRERELSAQWEQERNVSDALAAENERLLAANRDCIDWFDALKADYDKLREAAKLGLEALNVATTPLAKDRQEVLRAITALKEALGEME